MRPSTMLPACAIALFLLLSTSSAAPVAISNAPKEEKRFIRFDSYERIEAGSIINVPVQCPSDKVKVGNRCRSVF